MAGIFFLINKWPCSIWAEWTVCRLQIDRWTEKSEGQVGSTIQTETGCYVSKSNQQEARGVELKYCGNELAMTRWAWLLMQRRCVKLLWTGGGEQQTGIQTNKTMDTKTSLVFIVTGIWTSSRAGALNKVVCGVNRNWFNVQVSFRWFDRDRDLYFKVFSFFFSFLHANAVSHLFHTLMKHCKCIYMPPH